MWLTSNGEQLLDGIRANNQLTEKEQSAIKTYDGFMECRKLDPNCKSPGPVLINELQDILKKYADYTDPREG